MIAQSETSAVGTQKAQPLEIGTQLAYTERLKEQFSKLSQRQQEWLLMRFPGCQTDAEALERLKEVGTDIPSRTLTRWKGTDAKFAEVYNLMKTGLVDVVAHVHSTEVGEAIRVAMIEALELLKTKWGVLNRDMVKAKTDLIVHFTGGKAHSAKNVSADDGDTIRKLSRVIE